MTTLTTVIASTGLTTNTATTTELGSSGSHVALTKTTENLTGNSTITNDPVPGSLSVKPHQKDEEPAGTLLYRATWKTGRILQHFAVRSPHILIATAAVYLVTHYHFNDPKQAIENATFVGTASAAYCFVRPFFLETIPSSLLNHDQKVWRQLINISYTVFTTLTLSSCVWGLNVPALKGLAIWAASFGSSLFFLENRYPSLDARFKTDV